MYFNSGYVSRNNCRNSFDRNFHVSVGMEHAFTYDFGERHTISSPAPPPPNRKGYIIEQSACFVFLSLFLSVFFSLVCACVGGG